MTNDSDAPASGQDANAKFHQINVGLIVGLVIVLIFIIILALLVYLRRRKRMLNERPKTRSLHPYARLSEGTEKEDLEFGCKGEQHEEEEVAKVRQDWVKEDLSGTDGRARIQKIGSGAPETLGLLSEGHLRFSNPPSVIAAPHFRSHSRSNSTERIYQRPGGPRAPTSSPSLRSVVARPSVSPPPPISNSRLPPPLPPPSLPLPPVPALTGSVTESRTSLLYIPNPFADPVGTAMSTNSFYARSEGSHEDFTMFVQVDAAEAYKPAVVNASSGDQPLMVGKAVKVMYT
ncbi:hypothetical protein V5O48_002504 [Marasmius crinis-equi]|uniref:Uncharacterized protein n=1 Tax=Marasmius crinis-equi TaxID=585013 RepID=A0ABR3FVH6_9AGAR